MVINGVKQIINGNLCKYYVNNRNEFLGLFIRYYSDGGIMYKTNYFNDVEYGLRTWYNINGEIEQQKYYL